MVIYIEDLHKQQSAVQPKGASIAGPESCIMPSSNLGVRARAAIASQTFISPPANEAKHSLEFIIYQLPSTSSSSMQTRAYPYARTTCRDKGSTKQLFLLIYSLF